ncbi:unknown [Parabacteroides merdae CAG:48]|nr:unknown [Parabacteroides merdae CAG:48]
MMDGLQRKYKEQLFKVHIVEMLQLLVIRYVICMMVMVLPIMLIGVGIGNKYVCVISFWRILIMQQYIVKLNEHVLKPKHMFCVPIFIPN